MKAIVQNLDPTSKDNTKIVSLKFTDLSIFKIKEEGKKKKPSCLKNGPCILSLHQRWDPVPHPMMGMIHQLPNRFLLNRPARPVWWIGQGAVDFPTPASEFESR